MRISRNTFLTSVAIILSCLIISFLGTNIITNIRQNKTTQEAQEAGYIDTLNVKLNDIQKILVENKEYYMLDTINNKIWSFPKEKETFLLPIQTKIDENVKKEQSITIYTNFNSEAYTIYNNEELKIYDSYRITLDYSVYEIAFNISIVVSSILLLLDIIIIIIFKIDKKKEVKNNAQTI